MRMNIQTGSEKERKVHRKEFALIENACCDPIDKNEKRSISEFVFQYIHRTGQRKSITVLERRNRFQSDGRTDEN